VRLGHQGALAEYQLLLAAAYLVPLCLAPGRPVVLFSLATAPLAWRTLDGCAARPVGPLNPLLGATARLTFLHSAVLAASLAVS